MWRICTLILGCAWWLTKPSWFPCLDCATSLHVHHNPPTVDFLSIGVLVSSCNRTKPKMQMLNPYRTAKSLLQRDALTWTQFVLNNKDNTQEFCLRVGFHRWRPGPHYLRFGSSVSSPAAKYDAFSIASCERTGMSLTLITSARLTTRLKSSCRQGNTRPKRQIKMAFSHAIKNLIFTGGRRRSFCIRFRNCLCPHFWTRRATYCHRLSNSFWYLVFKLFFKQKVSR